MGDADGHACAGVVAAFLERTAGLTCEAAAEVAGVRPDTIRKWRRRLPRWLKASIARRLARLPGDAPPLADGLGAAFRRVLRPPAGDPRA
ncbi:hypothetical protein [Longimicrobium sp.]|uniref:hypothetical protein n=1 Tax=Longimicrobium sp. TaxID=2029185 RepID=UPI002E36CC61|nr:hypothetical protein [Longimicrobium sp.]HEX6038016.1 hypothetical protein [Longimicrobium sp.]